MEIINRKRAISLGLRVGIVFLTAVVAVIIIAYYVLSHNFQGLFTDYSLKLIAAMTEQGVEIVENELEAGRQEAFFMAGSFDVPGSMEETVRFPRQYKEDGTLRMAYVTDTETVTSDGRQRDLRERQDIREAFDGSVSVYGPYFNEENEFVICYSAPVRDGADVTGVLSLEKDGYRFCELIEDIRFVNSGECCIINAEGTDIAVSDRNHIDWVNSRYNGRKIYEEKADEETKTIIELEQKGLDGETGIGACYWKDGLCYVFYQPIPSVGWVFFTGLREEEIVSMTQSTLFSSISNGPVLVICFCLFFILTILIAWWMITGMKKTAEINEKLKIIANYDSLTGLMNRNSYHEALDTLFVEKKFPLACVYIDANGLHELNNHLGHQAGDQMLKAVADVLRHEFSEDGLYRIGGDEFVVLCTGKSEQEISCMAERVRQSLHGQNYEVSIGIAWRGADSGNGNDAEKRTAGHAAFNASRSAQSIVNEAETAMQKDKERFYRSNGNERRTRTLNSQLEQMIVEKQDADTFLAVLAPEFKGVYFVNLNKDAARHLYIPPYFEECLEEAENRFSGAILRYAERTVKPEYYCRFEELCDYAELEKKLNNDHILEIIYQKINGDWLKLRVLKFRDYTSEQRETLWIFAGTDCPHNS